jgi:DNA-binding NarL/FixJ family response regulator
MSAIQRAIQVGTIQVAVVEDDARLRRTFVDVLESSTAFRCVGAFATGAEAVAGIPALAPDVVIMDVNLPDTTGVECVKTLAPKLPGTQILMVTVYQDPDTTFQALAAGAHGYLVKPVLPERLLEAIREIRAGGVPMSRTIARKVIETFRSREAAEAAGTSAARSPAASLDEESLTSREQQVLELLVEGFSYKEISQRLGISTSTVGTYVQRIYEKLHVSSRREIMARRRPARG